MLRRGLNVTFGINVNWYGRGSNAISYAEGNVNCLVDGMEC